MISLFINCSDNGSALNDYFLLIRPKNSEHAPGTRAEIYDERGHHFLGFATIRTRSTILFDSINDTLALCFMAKPGADVKSWLKTKYAVEENGAVDILIIQWQERNVDACVVLQSIQYDNILAHNKTPSPAMLVRITQSINKYVQA